MNPIAKRVQSNGSEMVAVWRGDSGHVWRIGISPAKMDGFPFNHIPWWKKQFICISLVSIPWFQFRFISIAFCLFCFGLFFFSKREQASASDAIALDSLLALCLVWGYPNNGILNHMSHFAPSDSIQIMKWSPHMSQFAPPGSILTKNGDWRRTLFPNRKVFSLFQTFIQITDARDGGR